LRKNRNSASPHGLEERRGQPELRENALRKKKSLPRKEEKACSPSGFEKGRPNAGKAQLSEKPRKKKESGVPKGHLFFGPGKRQRHRDPFKLSGRAGKKRNHRFPP